MITLKTTIRRLDQLDGEIAKLIGDFDVECRTPYAGAVEYGTGPVANEPSYTPPVAPLIEWAEKKLGLKGKEARRVGWQIQHWIKEHGTDAHPYMRPAIADASLIVKELLANGGAENLANFIAQRAKDYLEANASVATGTLKNSIVVVKAVD